LARNTAINDEVASSFGQLVLHRASSKCEYTEFQSIMNVGVWNVSISFFEHLMQSASFLHRAVAHDRHRIYPNTFFKGGHQV